MEADVKNQEEGVHKEVKGLEAKDKSVVLDMDDDIEEDGAPPEN